MILVFQSRSNRAENNCKRPKLSKARDNNDQLCKDVDLLDCHLRDNEQPAISLQINSIKSNECYGSYVFIDYIYYLYLALSHKDVDLLDCHIGDKRTFCNLTADKHESRVTKSTDPCPHR